MGLDDVGQVGFFLIYQETLEIRPFHGADNQYLDATGLSWIRAVIMSTVLVPGGFGQTFGQIAHCRLVVDHERATALKCIEQAQQGIDGLVAGFVREILIGFNKENEGAPLQLGRHGEVSSTSHGLEASTQVARHSSGAPTAPLGEVTDAEEERCSI